MIGGVGSTLGGVGKGVGGLLSGVTGYGQEEAKKVDAPPKEGQFF